MHRKAQFCTFLQESTVLKDHLSFTWAATVNCDSIYPLFYLHNYLLRMPKDTKGSVWPIYKVPDKQYLNLVFNCLFIIDYKVQSV